MKNLLLLSIVSMIISCVPSKGSNKLITSTPKTTSTSGNNNPNVNNQLVIDTGVSLKTFNQYNMTLSKLTDVDAADPVIATEYNLIKNSLPGDHSASGYTPFHQISQTRLAFAYCNSFISNNSDFKSLDYANISTSSIATKLLDKFIGVKPAKNVEFYEKFNEVILSIMNNKATDDAGTLIGKLVPSATGVPLKIALTKLSCAAILSSAEFTTL
jgi:hypothetical protein